MEKERLKEVERQFRTAAITYQNTIEQLTDKENEMKRLAIEADKNNLHEVKQKLEAEVAKLRAGSKIAC